MLIAATGIISVRLQYVCFRLRLKYCCLTLIVAVLRLITCDAADRYIQRRVATVWDAFCDRKPAALTPGQQWLSHAHCRFLADTFVLFSMCCCVHAWACGVQCFLLYTCRSFAAEMQRPFADPFLLPSFSFAHAHDLALAHAHALAHSLCVYFPLLLGLCLSHILPHPLVLQFARALSEINPDGTVAKVYENRVAPMLMFAFQGAPLLFPHLLEVVPEGVISGTLTFVGLAGILSHNQFVERCVLCFCNSDDWPKDRDYSGVR